VELPGPFRVLMNMNYALNNMEHETPSEVMSGPVMLTQFERSPRLAEIKAVYKSRKRADERKRIRHPRDVENYLRAIWNPGTIELNEDFLVICLNGNHEALGWVKVSSGGFNATFVDPRLVFAVALQTASTSIIVAHNHPSGNTQPSEEDKELTRRLSEAGKLLSVTLLDHVIISKQSCFSFSENGLL
jgi:DNA repair protein RadC